MSSEKRIYGKDDATTVAELRQKVDQFVAEREWNQFHSPKNLSMAIAAEAAELMELFMWVEGKDSRVEAERKRQDVEDELADVMIACLCFASSCGIQVSEAIERKLAKTCEKYPVDKVRGRSDKYTEYANK